MAPIFYSWVRMFEQNGWFLYQVCENAVGPVAQWLEQATHNRSVVGSIPTRPTLKLVFSFKITSYEF